MAYRVKINEPLAKSIKRVVVEQVELAEQRLGEQSGEPEAVHDVRKNIKRVRALLRLIRPAIGEAAYHRENVRFREMGRLLAGPRDLDVMNQTVAALEADCELPVRRVVRKLKACMATVRQTAEANGLHEGVDKVREMLRETGLEFNRIKIPNGDFEVIGAGLTKCYRSCRKAFATAYASPSDDAIHEWRKTVQHHWRQMALLSRAWPEEMLARAHAARELSEILGLDHDLAMLKTYVHSDEEHRLAAKEREQVERLCCSRQGKLRAKARPRGERLLAESPTRFTARVACYWRAATDPGFADDNEPAAPRHKASGHREAEVRRRRTG